MTPCDHERDNLKAYADGELPLKTRLAVRLHLLRCGECRREIHEMKDLSASLKADDAGTLDDALRTRILNAVPDAAPDIPLDLPPLHSRFPRRRIPLYAFGMSAMALVGWFLFYPALNPASNPARQAARPSDGRQASLDSGPYTQDYDSQGNATQSARLSAPSKSYAPPAAALPAAALPAAALPATPAPAGAAKSSGAATGSEADKSSAPIEAAEGATAPRYDEKRESESKKPEASARAKSAVAPPIDGERKTRREANLTLEVDKTEARSEAVAAMTKTAGGYVANDNLQTEEDGAKTAALALKIPVAQFDAFLSQLSRLGDVTAKSVSGEDITEKINDQEEAARIVGDDVKELETKVQRARHSSRHDKEALRQLRIREAQVQARLKLLHNLSAFSDITVELREKPKQEPVKPQTGGFLNEMNATAHDAIAAFSQAARLPIALLIWAVVYLPLLLVLLAGYRFASRFWTRCPP